MQKLPVLKKSRIVFIYGCSILFYTLIVAASVRNVVESGGERYFGPFAKGIDVFSDLPSIVKNEIIAKDERKVEDTKTKHQFEFKNNTLASSDQMLVPSFDFNQNIPVCHLYDISTGKTIKKWAYNSSRTKIIESINPINKSDIFHPLMLKDSSIIFTSGAELIRLDKNNNILWENGSLPFHHSIEKDKNDNLWVCMTNKNNDFYPPLIQEKFKNYRDDGIVQIDPENGKILYQKSITKMLFENGRQYLIEGIGKVEEDQIHINDVQPVLTDSEYWKSGDLFISIRHRSTILLFRPSTDSIIWLKTGPWINQHDVDILSDNQISVFSNDASFIAMGLYDFMFTSSPTNKIYIYDFNTDSFSTPYQKVMQEANIATPSQGGCEILSNGDVIIDETEKGKVYLVDTSEIKFVFSDRIDDKHINMLSWVRYIKN
jgi:hypothetical protein